MLLSSANRTAYHTSSTAKNCTLLFRIFTFRCSVFRALTHFGFRVPTKSMPFRVAPDSHLLRRIPRRSTAPSMLRSALLVLVLQASLVEPQVDTQKAQTMTRIKNLITAFITDTQLSGVRAPACPDCCFLNEVRKPGRSRIRFYGWKSILTGGFARRVHETFLLQFEKYGVRSPIFIFGKSLSSLVIF